MQENSPISSKIKTIIAFTISILTVFSALLGWQLGNVSGEASGEYAAAQRAELNAQKVSSINTLNASENQRSFLTYKRYYDQYQLVSTQLRTAEKAETRDEVQIEELRQKQQELRALYSSNLKLFPNKFITRNGTYDKEAQLGQMWASASRKLDLDPKPHLTAGQRLDEQVRNMQVALLLLAVSLFFFAIVSTVESLRGSMLVTFVALGYVFAVFGMVMGIIYWKTPPASLSVPPRQVEQPASTNTPAPKQTAAQPTNTLAPTVVPDTPTPEIQQYYTEDFNGTLQYWPTYFVDKRQDPVISNELFNDVSFSAGDGWYLFDIQRKQMEAYSLYDPYEYEDVRVDIRTENQGVNEISFSLICHYSNENGWYEFNIANNGLYDIHYAKPNSNGYIAYRKIADGGSNKIKTGNAINEYSIICQGNALSLYINGDLVKETSDHLSALRMGKIGVSVSSFNVLPVSVRLDWIKISKP